MSAHEFPTASDYLQLQTIRQTQQDSCTSRQGTQSEANASGRRFPICTHLCDSTTGFSRSVHQPRNDAFQYIPEKKGVSVLGRNVDVAISFEKRELWREQKIRKRKDRIFPRSIRKQRYLAVGTRDLTKIHLIEITILKELAGSEGISKKRVKI
jgi:hypothetical protein